MSGSKLIYIVSDIDKALAFEWTALHLKSSHELMFILIGKEDTVLEKYLHKINVPSHVICDSQYPGHLRKWFRLFYLLWKEKPDIIHAHLWRANLLGLTTSWFLRIRKRVFTRHHATIHYDKYPSGRKWDRLCNAMATDIIAISKNIENILVTRDGANARKIRIIHHGFDFDYFRLVDDKRIEQLRTQYNLSEQTFPVIGVISRYIDWKGLQYIIPAFEKIRERYPAAKLMLANASGDYEHQVKNMLLTLPADSFVEIKFEKDLAALYKLFDVFVHVPVDPYAEAFGQTYVEGLITETASVFTLSGIAREFIRHRENALVVDFKNTDQIVNSVYEIVTDNTLRDSLKKQGLASVQQFSLNQFILSLENLYSA